MSYRIEVLPSARRELRKFAKQNRGRLLKAIAGLAENPRPQGSKKLVGADDLW